MSCISRANRIVRGFENEQIQKADKNEDKFVFYSYWMNHLALASVILAKKYGGISVSRCHGYDLYKRAENHQYVTLQRLLTKALDHVYPISDDGKNTLCSLFPDDVSSQHKVEVSRLGTHDFGIGPVEKDKGYFVIVSCSNVVPLKRVGLILDAVLSISDMPI